MYGYRAACECAGAGAAGPVRQSSSLAVTETDVPALHGVTVSLSLSTASSAGGSA